MQFDKYAWAHTWEIVTAVKIMNVSITSTISVWPLLILSFVSLPFSTLSLGVLSSTFCCDRSDFFFKGFMYVELHSVHLFRLASFTSRNHFEIYLHCICISSPSLVQECCAIWTYHCFVCWFIFPWTLGLFPVFGCGNLCTLCFMWFSFVLL